MVLIYDTKKFAQTYIDQLVPEKLFRYCKKTNGQVQKFNSHCF